MAERPLAKYSPEEKWMTVFRPQADPMVDEDGNVLGPNEALEAQRKSMEKTPEKDTDALVEERVRAEVKDLQIAGREQKKTLSEMVEDRKGDEKAKEELRKQIADEVKKETADSDKEEKKADETAKKVDAKVNEGAKAKQAVEGKKFNLAGGENK